MADGICALGGCDRGGQLRRGYCEPHYRAFRRYGDPLGSALKPERDCTVAGCTNVEQLRQGMCDMHYRRWRRNGVVGEPGSVRIIGNDVARFWSHVNLDGPIPDRAEWLGRCWQWTAFADAKGYGHAYFAGQVNKAHIWAYTVFVGPVPVGLELDHLCRNTSCVRPTHLEPVTKSENVRRRNLARAGKPWLPVPSS